jgi:hypothetical protein
MKKSDMIKELAGWFEVEFNENPQDSIVSAKRMLEFVEHLGMVSEEWLEESIKKNLENFGVEIHNEIYGEPEEK